MKLFLPHYKTLLLLTGGIALLWVIVSVLDSALSSIDKQLEFLQKRSLTNLNFHKIKPSELSSPMFLRRYASGTSDKTFPRTGNQKVKDESDDLLQLGILQRGRESDQLPRQSGEFSPERRQPRSHVQYTDLQFESVLSGQNKLRPEVFRFLQDNYRLLQDKAENLNNLALAYYRPAFPDCNKKNFTTSVEDVDTIHKYSFRSNIPLEDSELILRSQYFKPRTTIQNPLVTRYSIEPKNLCDGPSGAPYVLILIPSLSEHQEMRRVIRETWGSVVRWPWPGTKNLPQVKIAFVFGRSSFEKEQSVLERENRLWNDIIYADFVDSYRNLILKSMTSLHWASTRCPDAKFFMKLDEDTFINVPYLLEFLHYHESSIADSIIGYAIQYPVSVRFGKWAVGYEEYPLPVYPRYVYGHSYVIPRKVLKDLVQVSQYMPVIPVEDAFVTGVLAHTLKITRLHNGLFAVARKSSVFTCAVVKNMRVAVTLLTEVTHRQMWKAVLSNNCTYTLLLTPHLTKKPHS